jgi:hypothetical protein
MSFGVGMYSFVFVSDSNILDQFVSSLFSIRLFDGGVNACNTLGHGSIGTQFVCGAWLHLAVLHFVLDLFVGFWYPVGVYMVSESEQYRYGHCR